MFCPFVNNGPYLRIHPVYDASTRKVIKPYVFMEHHIDVDFFVCLFAVNVSKEEKNFVGKY